MPPASPAPAALGAMRPAEASLLRWAHAKGVKESWPLRPAFCPESNCRGMVATRAIQEGEEVLRIPEELLMSIDTAMRSTQIRALTARAASSGVRLCERQLLSIHLLEERRRGAHSPWHHFIQTIPRSFDTVENWASEDVEALQLPSLLRMAHTRRAGVDAEWAGLAPLLCDACPGMALREEDYRWAVGAISSRSCSFQHHANVDLHGESVGALVPVLDLLNHASGEVATCGFNSDARAYQVRVHRAYAPGEQVLIHYGAWSNAKLLEFYGFALPHNFRDSVHIHARAARSIP
ncbi:hypothetical protein T484DRAFT_1903943, partial [Baffinella frigidus]